MTLNRTFKLSALLLAVMVLTMAVYGFAASNTVPASNAGDGSNTISGYTVSDIHYELNGTDPSLIDAVEFNISPAVPAGGSVYIQLNGVDYNACTVTGGTAVTCTFAAPKPTVLDAISLRVIAVQ
jgi:hypothetical protein